MESDMIVANEPAYYQDGDFGIRVESHMVTVPSRFQGFLEFETISRLPIDPQLMDISLLTPAEKQWLADYHLTISVDYKDCFDVETARWLNNIVMFYTSLVR
jgi:Xaa-Pro aminopeptidase